MLNDTHAQRDDRTYSVPFLNGVCTKSKRFTVSRAQEFSSVKSTQLSEKRIDRDRNGCAVTET